MPQELEILTSTTMELSKIYDRLSNEVQGLKDMDDLEPFVKVGAELLIIQITKRKDLIETHGVDHALRCSIIEGIQYFDEILITRAREE